MALPHRVVGRQRAPRRLAQSAAPPPGLGTVGQHLRGHPHLFLSQGDTKPRRHPARPTILTGTPHNTHTIKKGGASPSFLHWPATFGSGLGPGLAPGLGRAWGVAWGRRFGGRRLGAWFSVVACG